MLKLKYKKMNKMRSNENASKAACLQFSACHSRTVNERFMNGY